MASKIWSSSLGRRIYNVSAECWYAAGGLGRVMQYHTIAMARLAQGDAELATVEPYYPFRLNASGHLEAIDYRSLAVPVDHLSEQATFEYQARLDNQPTPVPVQEYEGINRFGIHVGLIKDTWEYYTRLIYRYGQHNTALKEDFIDFMRHAADAYIRRREHKIREQNPSTYKAPVISAQDGQLIPLIEYSRAVCICRMIFFGIRCDGAKRIRTLTAKSFKGRTQLMAALSGRRWRGGGRPSR